MQGASPDSSVGKESVCNAGYPSSIPGSGRSPGEGIGCPLQYSGLEISVDCIVDGVAESRTRLVQSLGQEDSPEKEMATHSNIFAWEIPWTEEPGRLLSMGLQSWTQLNQFSTPATLTYCNGNVSWLWYKCQMNSIAAAAAKSLPSCPTLCDP